MPAICSEVLLVLVLVVLAWMAIILFNCPSDAKATTTAAPQKFTNNKPPVRFSNNIVQIPKAQPSAAKEHFTNKPPVSSVVEKAKEAMTNIPSIKYEGFANVEGVADGIGGAAPFKGASLPDDGEYLTVKYTGLVDGTPGEAIQIEGTDLLTAPLVDNMLYTNSIANTNRNASQDLRGDIPIQFNESYTPFYSSTIYGAPLSQHAMTIGTV
jgi:hypothetical protein